MKKLLVIGSWFIVHSKFIFLFLLFLLITISHQPPTIYASHCDSSGNFSSLNSYCDPATNTIWQDQSDCTHQNTGQACTTQTTCTYSENCDAGSGPTSGEHSCTGTNPNEAGQNQCGYNSAVAPDCSACTPVSTTPPSAVPPAAVAPAPVSGTTPTSASKATEAPESPEEAAIRHQDEGLRPEEVPGESDERPAIIKIVGDFFAGLGSFLSRLTNFVQNSGGLQTSELPLEQAAKDPELNDRISGFLGDKTSKGIYNNLTPDDQNLPAEKRNVIVGKFEVPGTKQANQREEGFEDAFLPEWCNKITTGECNVPP